MATSLLYSKHVDACHYRHQWSVCLFVAISSKSPIFLCPSQTQLSPNVLSEVNQAVTAVLGREEERSPRAGTKRKYTKSFTPEDQAKIGRYAAENGNAAAVRKFMVSHSIGESTVWLFKTRYLEETKKQGNPEAEVRVVPTLKRGRKVMLGEELNDKVKNYVQGLRINGAPIGSSIVMAAGEST